MSNVQMWPDNWDRPFELKGRHIDPRTMTIEFNGRATVVEPRLIALLIRLAQEPAMTVRRDTLIDEVWSGAVGSDQSLNNAVSLLRKALDDDKNGDALIQTVPKLGYRLMETPRFIGFIPKKRELSLTLPKGLKQRQLSLLAPLVITAFLGFGGFWGMLKSPPTPSTLKITDTVRFAVAPFVCDEQTCPLALTLNQEFKRWLQTLGAINVIEATTLPTPDANESSTSLLMKGELRLLEDETLILSYSIEENGGELIEREITVENAIALEMRSQFMERAGLDTSFAIAMSSTIEEEVPARQGDWHLGYASFPTMPTENQDAYDEYVIGAYNFWIGSPQAHATAYKHFRKAIELDASFADAHASLAVLLIWGWQDLNIPSQASAIAAARNALKTALANEPNHSHALTTLADIYNCMDRNPQAASSALERAQIINPTSISQVDVRLYINQGRTDHAVRIIEQQLLAFPSSTWQKAVSSYNMLAIGQTKRALELSEAALKLAPNNRFAGTTRARALSLMNRHQDAVEEMRRLTDGHDLNARDLTAYASIYGRAREFDQLRELLDTAVEIVSLEPRRLAIVHSWLGEIDIAFDYLDTAFEEGDFRLCYIASEPAYDRLREDARFNKYVKLQRGEAH